MESDGTSRFADRLRAEKYSKEEHVAIGIDGKSSGEVWLASMPEGLFVRCMYLGQAYELLYLPHIDGYSKTSFNKKQCARLMDEFAFIRERVNDSLLDEHLGRWIEVMRECLQHPRSEVELVIEGP